MKTLRKRAWSTLDVNLTPLVDVVFLMTIFFMTVLNFSALSLKDLNFPEADQAKKEEKATPITLQLSVLSENSIYLGRTKVNLQALKNVIVARVSDPSTSVVQLRGDSKVPYKVIQRVMQEIARAGIWQIDFSARIEEKAQ
jgi:biopolymer transport protein ExbD